MPLLISSQSALCTNITYQILLFHCKIKYRYRKQPKTNILLHKLLSGEHPCNRYPGQEIRCGQTPQSPSTRSVPIKAPSLLPKRNRYCDLHVSIQFYGQGPICRHYSLVFFYRPFQIPNFQASPPSLSFPHNLSSKNLSFLT